MSPAGMGTPDGAVLELDRFATRRRDCFAADRWRWRSAAERWRWPTAAERRRWCTAPWPDPLAASAGMTPTSSPATTSATTIGPAIRCRITVLASVRATPGLATHSVVDEHGRDALPGVAATGLEGERRPPRLPAPAGVVSPRAMGRRPLGGARTHRRHPLLVDPVAGPRGRVAGEHDDRTAPAPLPPPRHRA